MKPPAVNCPQFGDGNVTFRPEQVLRVLSASPQQSVISRWRRWPAGCCTGGSASRAQAKAVDGSCVTEAGPGCRSRLGTVPIPHQEHGDGGDPGEQGQSRGTAGQGPREHHNGRMHKHLA